VSNKRLQQVKNFKYLGFEMPCENEKVVQQKLETFSKILGVLNNTFKQTLVQKFSTIKVYTALALPIILCGSESCTFRKKYIKKMDTNQYDNFQNSRIHPFLPRRE
jgi:hypothetical protein